MVVLRILVFFLSLFLLPQIIVSWQIFSFWGHRMVTKGPRSLSNFPLQGERRWPRDPLATQGRRRCSRRKLRRNLFFFFTPFQATLRALTQEKEFSTMVSTTELQKTTGTVRFKTQTVDPGLESCHDVAFSCRALRGFAVVVVLPHGHFSTNRDTLLRFPPRQPSGVLGSSHGLGAPASIIKCG